MFKILLSDLTRATQGQLVGSDCRFTRISTDTRTLEPGDTFLALKGAQFDGHDYIKTALEKGAGSLVVSKVPTAFQGSAIVVPDPQKALGQIAHYWQAQFAIPMAALTGSFGKTTVKSMTTHLLNQTQKALCAQGNFNNEIGVPLTLLRLDHTYDVAVIEMAACHLGDIRYLMRLVNPTVSLIVDVFEHHLEKFGSLDNIIQEKGEVYRGLAPDATAVLPLDSIGFKTWRGFLPAGQRVLTFSLKNPADFYADQIVMRSDASTFRLHTPEGSRTIHLQQPGEHNIYNAIAASALAQVLGACLDSIQTGLETFSGTKQRLEQKIGTCGARILDDTYNASFISVTAALSVLSRFEGQKIAVIGEMGELGDKADRYHQKIGEEAKAKGIDRLLGIGPLMAQAVKAFGGAGEWYDNKSDLIKHLKATVKPEDTILVKGARFTKMEEVVEALC